MLAYHNDENLKQSVLAEMAEHREADRLVKGVYWEDGKGCARASFQKYGYYISKLPSGNYELEVRQPFL